MTREQLAALAEYRKHKGCNCASCKEAKKVLAEMDACGRRWPRRNGNGEIREG